MSTQKKVKIYLGVPYTSTSSRVRNYRFNVSCRICKTLMLSGYVVFSPVIHTHHLAENWGLPFDWEFWRDQDLPFLEWCDEFWIIMLPGWEKSKGLKEEILEAKKLGKYIVYIEPDYEKNFVRHGECEYTHKRPGE